MDGLTEVNKITVLDACVDGNETRFDRLVGQNFDTFNIIYNMVKTNERTLDCLKLICLDEDERMIVRVPTSETDLSNLTIPDNGKCIGISIDNGFLVLNTPIKKEW